MLAEGGEVSIVREVHRQPELHGELLGGGVRLPARQVGQPNRFACVVIDRSGHADDGAIDTDGGVAGRVLHRPHKGSGIIARRRDDGLVQHLAVRAEDGDA